MNLTFRIARLRRKDQTPSKKIKRYSVELINYEGGIEKHLVFVIQLFLFFLKFENVPVFVDLLTFVVL